MTHVQRVHMLRHGEPRNPEGIVYGLRPFPLSPKGTEQAREAGRYIQETFGNAEYVSSPVLRAKQTALYASGNPNYGTFESATEAVSVFDGEKVADVAKKARNWRFLLNPYKPWWNEAYTSQVSRMLFAVDSALDMQVSDVVIAGHQLPIWVTRLHLEGKPLFHDPAARQCGYASVTTITFSDGVPTEIAYWENPIK